MTMRRLKTFIVIIVVALVLVPIAINYLCLTVFPAPLVGDGKLWLGFWGSYLGGIIAVLSTVYVLYRNHEMEYNRKEYEIQKVYFDSLCVDMGKLCSAIDLDILSFYLMSMKRIEDANNTIQEIGKLEKVIICEYNEFCLKHAHNRGEEGEELINTYLGYSEFISSQISIVQKAVIERQTGKINDVIYYTKMGGACKELESLGDIRKNLFLLAQKWKKREWNRRENLRNIYING